MVIVERRFRPERPKAVNPNCREMKAGMSKGQIRSGGALMMMSDVEITHAAHLLVSKHGCNAELEAARYADIMSGLGDRDGLLTWSKIWRTIAVMRPARTGLPQ